MKYFKNVEVARLYKVSENTIGNWIEYAENGKNKLELIEQGKRKFIAKTTTNDLLMKELAEKGRKFKNRRSFKLVKAKPEFYKVFTEKQIIDIVHNIENYKEIPHKYTYFDGAAKTWDEYEKKFYDNDPLASVGLQALEEDKTYITRILKEGYKVNIVEIGPGNGLTTKRFVEYFNNNGLLNKYIGVDISPDMLTILEQNMKEWFGNDFPIETHVRDITTENIKDLLLINSNPGYEGEVKVINLILFIGGTIENQRVYNDALKVIRDSMNHSDLFLLEQALDTDTVKIRLAIDIDQEMMIPELLNIKPEYYEIKRFYDRSLRSRFVTLKLKVDLEIQVETENISRKIRLMNKDQVIVFRYNHHTNIEVFNTIEEIGFKILHTNSPFSGERITIISRTKNQSPTLSQSQP